MISIDLALLFQFINFLVLMLILNILLYKPIRRIFAEREAEILEATEKAAAVDKDVREKMAQYELKLHETKALAQEEKNRVILKAREEEAEILEKARKEASATVKSVQKQVARETDEARAALRGQIQALSGEIAEKVLGRSLQQ